MEETGQKRGAKGGAVGLGLGHDGEPVSAWLKNIDGEGVDRRAGTW